MRVLCCLNRDLASNVALNLLLPHLAGHEVRVGLTERVGTAAPAGEPWQRRELRAAEQHLPNEVLFPLIDRANQPDAGTRFLTFTEIARHRGIPVAALPNPNVGEGLQQVRDFAPDVMLTIRYGAILKAAVIAVPRLGVLNLHSGLLPDYRGVLATFRALMHGDTHIGCTLHGITDGTIDTGPVIATARVPVERERSLLWHVLRLYEPGIALMSEALARLERGEAHEPVPQRAGEGAYFTYPTPDEWAEFTRAGWTVAQPSDLDSVMRRFMPAGA